jgi:hypothetical protein
MVAGVGEIEVVGSVEGEGSGTVELGGAIVVRMPVERLSRRMRWL